MAPPATPAPLAAQQQVADQPAGSIAEPRPAPPVIVAQAIVGRTLGSRSFDVEQMARESACEGDGAWLTGKQGDVETYQVSCTNGSRFLATCDSEACHPAS